MIKDIDSVITLAAMINPSNKENIFNYIDGQKKEIIKYLQKLIKIDTHVPPGLNYDKICQVLANRFNEYDCSIKIIDATEPYLKASGKDFINLDGPRSNIIAKFKGSEEGVNLHLSAHIDTVPFDPKGWTHDPLSGDYTPDNPNMRSPLDIGGGYIWGRGACDDKSMLTAMTFAVQAIHDLGYKLKGDLILTGNCDEEIGGVAGLGFLIKEGHVKADYGIQLDGDLFKMGLAAQGRVRYHLTTFGKSYHGQMPILGINSIEKMSKINVALTEHWRNDLLNRQQDISGITLPENIIEAGYDKLTAMLNLGTIKGGVQGATVPDLCVEEILRCMIPRERESDVTEELKTVINRVKKQDPELMYKLEIINSRDGYIQDPHHPYIKSSRKVVSDCLGIVPEFTGNLASTDMNYQVNDGSQACFTLGIGHPYTRYHQKDESVCIDDLIMYSKILTLLIIETLELS